MADHVTVTDGINWIQKPSQTDSVAWVPDPVRGTNYNKVLRFKVDQGYIWSGDAKRTDGTHNRCEMIVWPSTPNVAGHSYAWAPTEGQTYYEGIGYLFPVDFVWPPESVGGTYNLILSQTNDDSVTPNTHYYGATLRTESNNTRLDFAGSIVVTKADLIQYCLGHWLHAKTQITYSANATVGQYKTDLYLDGQLWRSGTTVTKATMGTNGPAKLNRKAGIYRNEYSNPAIVYIDPFIWGTSVNDPNFVLGGFTGPADPTGGTTNDGNLGDLYDDFSSATKNTDVWRGGSGSPTQVNGELVMQANAGATTQSYKSGARLAAGQTLIVGPWTAGDITSGSGNLDRIRMALIADDVNNNRVTLKVTKGTSDGISRIFAPIVTGGAEEAPTDPGAVWDSTMVYFKWEVASDGLAITCSGGASATGPWTTVRTMTPAGWNLAPGKAAKFEVAQRLVSGTIAATGTRLGAVGIETTGPTAPSTASVTTPTGAALGELVLVHAAASAPAAVITNTSQLPFANPMPVSTGVAVNNSRQWAFIKRHDPTTSTSWSLNFDQSTSWVVHSHRIAGLDINAPDYGIANTTLRTVTTAASSFTLADLTAPIDDARLLVLAACNDNNSAQTWGAAPSGWTKQYAQKAANNTVDLAAYSFDTVNAGDTVSVTFTHGASVQASFIVMWLRPGVLSAAGDNSIVDGGVSTAKLADSAVTTVKLSAGSVTATKVNDALKPSGSATAGTEALRALGTTASTAAAGNDTRLSRWWLQPSDWNCKILTMPPDAVVGNTSAFTSGSIYLIEVAVPEAVSLTTMKFLPRSNAVGTANAILGVYDAAYPTATLLGKTADTASLWATTNTNRSVAMIETTTGSLAINGATTTRVRLAVLFGTVGSTAPAIGRGGENQSSTPNFGRTAAPYRAGVVAGTYTDLPATLDLTGQVIGSILLLGAS